MNTKNWLRVVGIVLISVSLFSCSTKKNMTYFRDIEGEIIEKGLPVPPADHIIKPNDNLFITVKTIDPEINELFSNNNGGGAAAMNNQRFQSLADQYIYGYQVDSRGKVFLPIMGEVHLAGLTLAGAQNEIMRRAGEYLKDANIQVKLLNFKVSLLGEVRNPGVLYNYNNTLTILEAISMAGGITEYGELRNILVMREVPQGTKSFQLDLTQKSILDSEAFYLQPNDMVYIKAQTMKSTRINTTLYTLILSSISTLLVILRFMAD
ncbi:MAG: polysaccharide biosynthesis/export family protein [Mangrovibacterium sp.]